MCLLVGHRQRKDVGSHLDWDSFQDLSITHMGRFCLFDGNCFLAHRHDFRQLPQPRTGYMPNQARSW
jgi:hypothetical protein